MPSTAPTQPLCQASGNPPTKPPKSASQHLAWASRFLPLVPPEVCPLCSNPGLDDFSPINQIIQESSGARTRKVGNTYTVSNLSFALKGPPSSKEPHALLWLNSDSGAQQPGPYRGGHGVPGHAANAPLTCLLLCAAAGPTPGTHCDLDVTSPSSLTDGALTGVRGSSSLAQEPRTQEPGTRPVGYGTPR